MCQMFRFFPSPSCGFIVIGYYVAAGMEEHMHDIYTYIRWKGEMLFHETHTYSALYLLWESGKGVFSWIHKTKKTCPGAGSIY